MRNFSPSFPKAKIGRRSTMSKHHDERSPNRSISTTPTSRADEESALRTSIEAEFDKHDLAEQRDSGLD
jgi:hypothetical protein